MAVAILSRERARTLRESAMTQVSSAIVCAPSAQSPERNNRAARIEMGEMPLSVVVERWPRRARAIESAGEKIHDQPTPVGTTSGRLIVIRRLKRARRYFRQSDARESSAPIGYRGQAEQRESTQDER
jgi:hypothetical protein